MPTHFYKIVVVKDGDNLKAIAFVMPNIEVCSALSFGAVHQADCLGGATYGIELHATAFGGAEASVGRYCFADVALVMSVHDLLYRPLRAGTSIVNERIESAGDLGFIANDAAGAAWIVSCYHVLCEVDLKAYVTDDAVFQPAAVVAGNQIAVTRRRRRMRCWIVRRRR